MPYNLAQYYLFLVYLYLRYLVSIRFYLHITTYYFGDISARPTLFRLGELQSSLVLSSVFYFAIFPLCFGFSSPVCFPSHLLPPATTSLSLLSSLSFFRSLSSVYSINKGPLVHPLFALHSLYILLKLNNTVLCCANCCITKSISLIFLSLEYSRQM